jgi:circadian clock protein KaiC
MHLVAIHKLVRAFKPRVVILDPITNLVTVGTVSDVKSMLIRLIDFLQEEGITVMFTALTLNTVLNEQTDEGVSSLVDAWITVRDIESNGERNRGLYVMKSRGMKHSNQVREFMITDAGLELVDVYLGPEGVLTGSAREARQLMEKAGDAIRDHAVTRTTREIARKSTVLEARISGLREEFESVQEELRKAEIEDALRTKIMEEAREELTRKRHNGK